MKKIRKIVIVDDDSMTAFLHMRFLEYLDVADEIMCITNPYDALAYVRERYAPSKSQSLDTELMFLDVEMPGLNGFEFLEALDSEHIDRSRLSIVMLTTSLLPEYRKKAEQIPDKIKAYLVKPLRKETVDQVLTTL